MLVRGRGKEEEDDGGLGGGPDRQWVCGWLAGWLWCVCWSVRYAGFSWRELVDTTSLDQGDICRYEADSQAGTGAGCRVTREAEGGGA